MKDTRFTELVNLYIDRQISPEEAAELELEIQSNPRRRQVYRQYCQMHRATKLVYESFRAHATEGGQPVRQPASIASLQSRIRQRRMRWVYAASGLAAAACVAIAVLRFDFNGPANAGPQSLSAAKTLPAAPAVAAAEHPAVPANRAVPRTQVELTGTSVAARDYASILTSIRQEEDRLLSLQNAAAPRLSLFDDGVFDERSMLQNRANLLQKSKNQRVQTEFTAFQFQR
jgi:hypothetical protein